MSDLPRPLDFVVIGASKSGTTSLFHYLRAHPRIALPADKDFPYFRSEELMAQGWARSAGERFGDPAPDVLLGTVTPAYMEDPRVAERMAKCMPNLRLIALLRNPIDRALSQYRQQVRRGKEPRSFEALLGDELSSGEARESHVAVAPGSERPRAILAEGRYGRILAEFLRHFPREQLLVQFTEDLEQRPLEVLEAILGFLGLPSGFTPPNLDRRYHVGGSRERFPGLLPGLRRVAPLRALWRLVPRSRRRAFWMTYFTSVNVRPEPAPELGPTVRSCLVEHYRSDVSNLERLLGQAVPWTDFRPVGP
jgi:hypothetical protein